MNPPLVFEGGWRDRVIRGVWLRGNEFGYAAIFVSADGQAMNVRRWHEEVIPLFQALPLLGTRAGDAAVPPAWTIHDGWLQRFKRVPVYGIEFDAAGAVNAAASGEALAWLASKLAGGGKHTILLREYSRGSAPENLTATEQQAQALRQALQGRGANLSAVTIRGVGTTEHKESPATPVERPMFSRVELIAE
jgi:hypothetical protein